MDIKLLKNSPLSEGCDFSRGVFKSSQSNSNHEENQFAGYGEHPIVHWSSDCTAQKQHSEELMHIRKLKRVLFIYNVENNSNLDVRKF